MMANFKIKTKEIVVPVLAHNPRMCNIVIQKLKIEKIKNSQFIKNANFKKHGG